MQTYIVYSSKSYTMVDETNDQFTMNICAFKHKLRVSLSHTAF